MNDEDKIYSALVVVTVGFLTLWVMLIYGIVKLIQLFI